MVARRNPQRISHGGHQGRCAGSAGQGRAPDGAPLPTTGTLSDIVASDGKVFFSISVDAAVVQAWEPVRKRAEEAVKAIPGVAVGDGGADRRAQGRRRGAARGPASTAGGARRPRARAATASSRADRRAGRDVDHRGRLGQGRRRQVHHRGQSGARPARPRHEGRHARRRHLRAVAAEAARHPREAADRRRHAAEADRAATASPSCRSDS